MKPKCHLRDPFRHIYTTVIVKVMHLPKMSKMRWMLANMCIARHDDIVHSSGSMSRSCYVDYNICLEMSHILIQQQQQQQQLVLQLLFYNFPFFVLQLSSSLCIIIYSRKSDQLLVNLILIILACPSTRDIVLHINFWQWSVYLSIIIIIIVIFILIIIIIIIWFRIIYKNADNSNFLHRLSNNVSNMNAFTNYKFCRIFFWYFPLWRM